MLKHYFKQTLILLLELILFGIALSACLGIYFILIYPLFNDIEISELDLEGMIVENPIAMLCVNFLPMSIIALVVIWFVHSLLYRRSEYLLGFNRQGLFREFGIGWILATLMIIAGFFILQITDQIDVVGLNFRWTLILGFLLMFLVQSFSEEILFRSYLIPAIQTRIGAWPALIISSLVFMAVHLGNANINIIGGIDLFLGGIFMGLLFMKYQNIWAPTGFHVAWNYMQSTILGFEVSGIETYSWIDQLEKGNDIYTGGEFGFEGSILSIVFLIAVIYWLWSDSPKLRELFKSKGVESQQNV